MPLRRHSDEGLGMVEVLVAIAIVTVGLLGLLQEMVTYIQQQYFHKSHATAMRIATTTLEDARRAPVSSLQNSTGPVPNHPQFTRTTSVQLMCGTGSTPCTGSNGPAVLAQVQVKVSWKDQNGPHHVSLSSSSADPTTVLPGSTSGFDTNLTGADGLGVAVSSLTVGPTPALVDTQGHPTSDVTVTMLATGLTSTTTIPVTWTDDTGGHQVSMAGNGSTWSVTIPASEITRVLTGSSSGTVTFVATVPGVQGFPSTTLTLFPTPTFGTGCTVAPSPIVLVPLTRNTSVPEVLTCTTTGLSTSDSVQAAYGSGTGTATAGLTTLDGSTWTATLAAGTPMVASGSTETFTFTLTRSSDGYAATQTVSVPLS